MASVWLIAVACVLAGMVVGFVIGALAGSGGGANRPTTVVNVYPDASVVEELDSESDDFWKRDKGPRPPYAGE